MAQSNHEKIERNVFLMILLTVLTVSVGGLVEIVPLFFQTSTTATDQYVADAMQKVDAQLSDCESDYIVGDGSNGCPNGSKCLRIWISRIAPTCP